MILLLKYQLTTHNNVIYRHQPTRRDGLPAKQDGYQTWLVAKTYLPWLVQLYLQ